MAQADLLDILVLVAILLATGAYFTKGSLWAVEDIDDKYKNGFGSGADSEDNRNIVTTLEENNKDLIVFYGSQTGTAEDYANRLAKEALQKYGLKTMTADIEGYDFENLDKVPSDKVLGFVMATYGEGEPTDSAVQFFEFINNEDVEFSEGSSLENLKYVIFGLGNSTYEHYNFIGRELDKKLQALGAHRIGVYGEGDDGTGTMEEDYLAWKEEIFPVWQKEENLEEHEAIYEPLLSVTESEVESTDESVFLGEYNKTQLAGTFKGPFSASNPFPAPVTAARELFQVPGRNCIHMEFDISGSGLKYNTGDHLAVLTQNSDEEVNKFLEVFGLLEKRHQVIDIKALDPTAKVHFPTPTTYETVVRYHLEINGIVSRQLLSTIAPFAPTAEAKKIALRLGSSKDDFAAEIAHKYYNLSRALRTFSAGVPWTDVPFSFIAENVNKLIPRYYSISSSAKENPNVISVTAVVESIKPQGSDHVLKGVATNNILSIKHHLEGTENPDPTAVSYQIEGPRGSLGSSKMPVFVRHSNFKLPSNPQKPIIMVGPGTGVAPFRAFVHERAFMAAKGTPVGPALLFFGCRSVKEDFLYQDEWSKFSAETPKDLKSYLLDEERKALTENSFLQLSTAFSRDGPEKVYVQHRLKENAELVNLLLKKGAVFYVCGDAMRMARDVQSTLIDIISEQRNIPRKRAEDLVKNMRTQNCYQEDVW